MNQITISSDSDSDASVFASSTTTSRHPPQSLRHHHPHHHHHNHHHHTHHPTIPTTSTTNNPSSTTPSNTEKRKTTTHHVHETVHLTNTILSSKELLLLHSLAANESVPSTRRRFMAQLIEPEDPLKASKLVWDSQPPFSSTAAGRGGEGKAVGGLRVAAGNIVDVVEEDDANGWEKLRVRKSTTGGGGGSPMARKTSSPGGAKKGQQSRVVSGSRTASGSGSPLASPAVRRRGRREDGDGNADLDMDIN